MYATGTPPKIAIIGAGSYVFSLGLLHDLIVEHRLAGSRLVLMDVNEEMAATMAGIARRMAGDTALSLSVEATADRETALRDADYVTTSAAVQLLDRYRLDREVAHANGIAEILGECGGLGGLSYTLRQVPLILGIARDMERLCPHAWLFNVSNPLPRVMTAVSRHTRIKAAGFCNAAWGASDGYGHVARLIHREKHDLNVVSGGLNHFSWLLSARDRWTGEDLMPLVNNALAAGGQEFGPLTRRLWEQTGCLALAGDEHTGEFIPFDPAVSTERMAHHGVESERAARRRELVETAAGTRSWAQLLAGGRCWERPADAIHALATGTRRRLDMVNIQNCGAIAGLPDDAVVEVPAMVAGGQVCPVPVGNLPPPLTGLVAAVSRAHALAAEAAVTGERDLLAEAIAADPAIPDKPAARRAIEELIRVHADQLPQFD